MAMSDPGKALCCTCHRGMERPPSIDSTGKTKKRDSPLSCRYVTVFLLRFIICSAVPLALLALLVAHGPELIRNNPALLEPFMERVEPAQPQCPPPPRPLADLLPLTRAESQLRDPYTLTMGQHSDTDGEEVKGPYPHLCFLARTYPAVYRYLPAFLASLTQMPMNLSVLMVSTEPDQRLDVLQAVVETANAIGGADVVKILPITIEEARKAFPALGKTQEYGYAYTDAALDLLTSDSSTAQCDFIVVTNGDNLYSRLLPRHVVPLMQHGAELMAFDFVTGHRLWSMNKGKRRRKWVKSMGLPAVVDSFLLKCQPVRLQTGLVDLGAMVVSMNLIKRSNLRFLSNKMKDYSLADGAFAEGLAKLTKKKVLIGQTLLMHQ